MASVKLRTLEKDDLSAVLVLRCIQGWILTIPNKRLYKLVTGE